MRIPDAHCPDCNSRQRFASKKRTVNDKIEFYIHCYACGYEKTIATYTKETLRQARKTQRRRNQEIRRRVR